MTENNFDTAALVAAAGATFVARTTSYHVAQMEDMITQTLSHKGFSVLEIISGCPTGYGRKNGQPEAFDALEWQKANAVVKTRWDKMTEEERAGKFPIGVLHTAERPEYIDSYDRAVGLKGNTL